MTSKISIVVKDYLLNTQSCPSCGSPIIQLPTGAVRSCRCTGAQRANAPVQPPDQRFTEMMADVIEQACVVTDNTGKVTIDSQGKRAYAEAILYLADNGKCKVISRQGRRVIAVWI